LQVVRISIATTLAGSAIASLLAIHSIHSTEPLLSRHWDEYISVISIFYGIPDSLDSRREEILRAVAKLDNFARLNANKLSIEIEERVGA
jgi:hypothetical protein